MNEKNWMLKVKDNQDDLEFLVDRFCGYFIVGEFRDFVEAGKSFEIYRILSTTWENAPDRRDIHFLRGWDSLCDLLSCD